MKPFFGVDYYPEHWPRERWEEDAVLMRELGITVVRMGEFAWAKFEPELGTFDFTWMDDAIALLERYGIRTILGTPTAAPPAWMIRERPEYLPVDSYGVRRGFGGRHHDCQSNAGYRQEVRRIVTAMAKHYAHNPAVIGWQVDNELGNSHDDLCFCSSCTAAFQTWLEKKYQTIADLNAAWGTVFWSQTYRTFQEISAPSITPNVHNPSLLLDWKRFCSDLVVDFQQEQITILRSFCPGHIITHNFMGFAPKADEYDLARSLDVVSNDQYPTGFFQPDDTRWAEQPAALDFIRGTKQQNFWMMELQSGGSGTDMLGEAPRPGELMLWAANAVAHGADSIVWFRWRTCCFGPEQYWHGILPHNGLPNRRFRELRETVIKLAPVLEDIAGVYTAAEAAVVFDYNAWWAFQIQPNHRDFDYRRMACRWYEGLYQQNIPVDFTGVQADWSAYRLLIVPYLYLCDDALCERLKSYVKQGGSLILTYRSLVKNQNSTCFMQGQIPHQFTDVIGAEIDEYSCLYRGEKLTLAWHDGHTAEAVVWQDILHPTTAQILAKAGLTADEREPAVLVNRYGKGRVWYIGTELCEKDREAITAEAAAHCGLTAYGQSGRDVEIRLRRGRGQDYLFVLNATDQEQPFILPPGWALDDDHPVVRPFGVRIFNRKHA